MYTDRLRISTQEMISRTIAEISRLTSLYGKCGVTQNVARAGGGKISRKLAISESIAVRIYR